MHKLQFILMLLLIPMIGLYMYADYKRVPVKELVVPGDPVVHIAGIPIRVDIADTESARKQGLSGRAGLEEARGMLFVFDEPGYHGMWMKDMQFPIDVVWVSEDLRVVEVVHRLDPDTYPQIFEPPQPAKYMIETKVNFTETFGIQVGDSVRLPYNYTP